MIKLYKEQCEWIEISQENDYLVMAVVQRENC